MSREHERVVHMVSELLNVLFSMGASKIDVRILEEADRFFISLQGKACLDIRQKLKKTRRLLRMNRSREMEEELWSLAGSVDYDTELSLVGMMTDEAEIRYDEETGVLVIELLRKK
jgi:hypothetical protein